MRLVVCPFQHVPDQCRVRRPSHLLTLLSPEWEAPPLPPEVSPARRLHIHVDDIAEPAVGFVAPTQALVSQMLAFGGTWSGEHPFLVHCWAGISRSTAAALAIACQARPELDERALAGALRAASPEATPNSLILALADGLLGRRGRLIEAGRSIGFGAAAALGRPFELDLARVGR